MPKKSVYFDYALDSGKFLDESADRHFLKLYPEETPEVSKLTRTRKSERAKYRKSIISYMEPRLKARAQAYKKFLTAYEQHIAPVQPAVAPQTVPDNRLQEMQIAVRAVRIENFLHEWIKDDALVNSLTILRNEEERSGCVSEDARAELEPLEMRDLRLTYKVTEQFHKAVNIQ